MHLLFFCLCLSTSACLELIYFAPHQCFQSHLCLKVTRRGKLRRSQGLAPVLTPTQTPCHRSRAPAARRRAGREEPGRSRCRCRSAACPFTSWGGNNSVVRTNTKKLKSEAFVKRFELLSGRYSITPTHSQSCNLNYVCTADKDPRVPFFFHAPGLSSKEQLFKPKTLD